MVFFFLVCCPGSVAPYLQLGLEEGLGGRDRRRRRRAVAARALLQSRHETVRRVCRPQPVRVGFSIVYLAEDPICGVEVGALVVLADEGLLRRNASVLALSRCLQTRKELIEFIASAQLLHWMSIIIMTRIRRDGFSFTLFLPEPHILLAGRCASHHKLVRADFFFGEYIRKLIYYHIR